MLRLGYSDTTLFYIQNGSDYKAFFCPILNKDFCIMNSLMVQ